MPSARLKMALGPLFVLAAVVIVDWAGKAGGAQSERPGAERQSSPARHSGTFEFVSDEPGSSFECRLDRRAWQDCEPPKSYFGLPPGSHSFEVRATDRAGNRDQTPARHVWSVKATAAADEAAAPEQPETAPPRKSETRPSKPRDPAAPESSEATPPDTTETTPPDPTETTPPDPTETAPPRIDTDPPETTITRAPSDAKGREPAPRPRRSQVPVPWRARCLQRVPPSVVARRVELIRGLDFMSSPRIAVVSPARFRREFATTNAAYVRLASMRFTQSDLTYGAPPYRAFARIAGVSQRVGGVSKYGFGLIAPELYQRAPLLRATAHGAGAARSPAIYDGARKLVVANRRARGCAAEYALAHELSRALEEQWTQEGWEVDLLPEALLTDRAFEEGLATAVAARYAVQHLGTRSVGDVLAWQRRLAERGPMSTKLAESRAFVYGDGPRFVASILERGGWRLLQEKAYNVPPFTTAEIRHPQLWPGDDLPYYADPGNIAAVQVPLEKQSGGRWAYAGPGNVEIGELETVVLLRAGLDRRQARRAAAGMHGGAILAMQCVERCRGDFAATAAWAWRTPGEAREFAAALPTFLEAVVDARRAGDSTWSFDRGAVAVAVKGCITGLAFAPSAPLAATLARAPIDKPNIPPRPC